MSEKKKIKIDVGEEASEPEAVGTKKDQETGAAAEPADPLQELEQKLLEAENKAKDSYDRMLRAVAELENFKKRKEKEIADFRKFANESIIKELLNIVDNLERAIETPSNGGGSEEQIAQGVDLTIKELLKVFQKYGVERLSALGETFDPAFHEAMMQLEMADQPDNTVVQELQKGYTMHERLLRPAMVVVSKSNNKTVGCETDDEENKP